MAYGRDPVPRQQPDARPNFTYELIRIQGHAFLSIMNAVFRVKTLETVHIVLLFPVVGLEHSMAYYFGGKLTAVEITVAIAVTVVPG